jgi:hypothetical protein
MSRPGLPRSVFSTPSAGTLALNLAFVVASSALAVTSAMWLYFKHAAQGWRQGEVLATDVAALGALVAALALRFVRRNPRALGAWTAVGLVALAGGTVATSLLARGGVLQGVFVATVSVLLALGFVGLTRISTASWPLVVAVLACALTGILFTLVLPQALPWTEALGLRSWFEAGVVLLATGLAVGVPVLVRRRAL